MASIQQMIKSNFQEYTILDIVNHIFRRHCVNHAKNSNYPHAVKKCQLIPSCVLYVYYTSMFYMDLFNTDPKMCISIIYSAILLNKCGYCI